MNEEIRAQRAEARATAQHITETLTERLEAMAGRLFDAEANNTVSYHPSACCSLLAT